MHQTIYMPIFRYNFISPIFCAKMGYAGDILGRDHAMTLTLSIVTVAAMLSAAAPHGTPSNIYITIIIMRFLLGIGVGGVYPLSATKAAEDAGKGDGVNLTAASWAFFWQVPGSMVIMIYQN
jgi:PHS family inorganic phosphate transporter-like MFS transporter